MNHTKPIPQLPLWLFAAAMLFCRNAWSQDAAKPRIFLQSEFNGLGQEREYLMGELSKGIGMRGCSVAGSISESDEVVVARAEYSRGACKRSLAAQADDQPLGKTLLDDCLPKDIGAYFKETAATLCAAATARLEKRMTDRQLAETQRHALDLQRQSVAPRKVDETDRQKSGASWKSLGWPLVAFGGLAAAGGVYLWAIDGNCVQSSQTSGACVKTRETNGLLRTGALVGGLVAAGLGAWLVFGTEDKTALAVGPGGLTLHGRF
jgi:hypothetical protein